jgi:curli production assembly/transport component CsgE
MIWFLKLSIVVIFSLISTIPAFCQERDTLPQKELPEELKSILRKYQKDFSLDEEKVKEEDLSIELDGLIIDETISKIGHDFYNYFNDNWDIPESVKNFTIYIKEKPMPGMGNLITLKINYEEIFKNRISPRQEVIENLANYAIQRSQQYLINYQEIKEQLEGEDMSGTGIY